MNIIFTLTNVDTQTQDWVLTHNPQWETPFETISGLPHVWNWDFINGNLLKDGEALSGYTITIERN